MTSTSAQPRSGVVPARYGSRDRPQRRAAALIREQSGVITTAQARAAGMTGHAIRWQVARGNWQWLYPRVYATFSGPVPRRARLCAAVLAAGRGAVLSHQSAAELAGLIPLGRPSDPIHVTVPERRRVFARLAGVVVHRSSRVERARHPALLPPQTWFEETVIDLTQTATTLRDAWGWLAMAVNSQKTTADRLLTTIQMRPRLRWRRPLREALGDVRAGCRSVLELRYLNDVERAHALPTGERQSPERRPAAHATAPATAHGTTPATHGTAPHGTPPATHGTAPHGTPPATHGTAPHGAPPATQVAKSSRRGGNIYIDVRYREFGVWVELDGRAAHPDHLRHRDRARDNLAAERHEAPLRYDTPDVVEHPCESAAQVGRALRHGGWLGTPARCARQDCVISDGPRGQDGADHPRS